MCLCKNKQKEKTTSGSRTRSLCNSKQSRAERHTTKNPPNKRDPTRIQKVGRSSARPLFCRRDSHWSVARAPPPPIGRARRRSGASARRLLCGVLCAGRKSRAPLSVSGARTARAETWGWLYDRWVWRLKRLCATLCTKSVRRAQSRRLHNGSACVLHNRSPL